MSAAQQMRGAAARLRPGVQRPPWTDEAAVRDRCTSCGDCISACPEAILFKGPAGTPTLDFNAGACTFCGDCATACAEGVFRPVEDLPWMLAARIGGACLLQEGVSCRSCTDVCDTRALRFDLRRGAMGTVEVDRAACNGCGACLGTCPVGAITLQDTPLEEAAE